MCLSVLDGLRLFVSVVRYAIHAVIIQLQERFGVFRINIYDGVNVWINVNIVVFTKKISLLQQATIRIYETQYIVRKICGLKGNVESIITDHRHMTC